MLRGTVKFYNRQKGFGFITRDDGADDLFVSASSLAACGLKTLDLGQRVSFEAEKDPRGFKAAQIKLEANVAPSAAAQSTVPQAAVPQTAAPQAALQAVQARVTVYYDPAIEAHQGVAAALRKNGEAIRLVDYAAAPPARDELKRLSLQLGANGQSLVRRYDPLFFALQLDDRFLSENEYWDAIVEHPKLIDGPIVAWGNKARLCKTGAEAQAFLQDKQEKTAKTVSPRLLAMMKGRAVPPLPEKEAVPVKPVPEKPAPAKVAPAKVVPVEAPPRAEKKKPPEKTAKPKPQPKAKAAKPAAKPPAKSKPVPKKSAKAPAKSASKAKAKTAKRTKR